VSHRIEGAMFGRSPVGAAALTAIVIGLAVWTVTGSKLFAIQNVSVLGARHLTPDDVERISGIRLGENLIRLSTDTVASRLGREPWIRSARVSRSLPSTLVIEVVERRGVGWLQDPEGAVIVSADGLVLERSLQAPRDLPALGAWSAPLRPGDRLDAARQLVRVAASLEGDLLARISDVRLAGDEVVLGLRSGGEVRYGPALALGPKTRALTKLIAWADRRGVQAPLIDLRIPSAPTLTPGRA
jgi:cell division protein FtsQ